MLKTLRELIEMLGERKSRLYFSIFLSFIDSCLFVTPIIIAFYLIGSIPELSGNTERILSSDLVIKYAVIMLGCVVVRIILRYFTLYFRSGAGYEVMSDERKHLGQKLRKVSMGYFNQRNLGDLVSVITSDVSFIEIEGLGVVEKLAIGIPSIIIGLAILLFFDYRAALAALIFLVPAFFAYKYLASTQDRLNLNRQKIVGGVTEDVVEFDKGLHVLKTFNMAEKQFSRTLESFERLKKISLKIEFAHILPTAVFQLVFRLITVAVICIAGISAVMGNIPFSSAFVLMLGSFSLFPAVELMGVYSIFSKMTQHSIDRINQIKKIPWMDDTSGSENIERFDVSFKDVHFAYDKIPVLSGISFSVPEKTTTALVGLSGSGKTTITNLVARFWDVKKGRVMIGGNDVNAVAYEDLLKNLSFVFQDVFLFDDTALNNIRIGRPDASTDEVIEASRRAGCNDFIERMENGYDTMLGETGVRLSGGEKQRISIARALIKDAPIVLLDEVTANIDVENEQQIHRALRELLKDRTVIMIAHKLSTIKDVDQILVMDNGRISQRGRHHELVSIEGLYKNLWDMQYRTGKWRL